MRIKPGLDERERHKRLHSLRPKNTETLNLFRDFHWTDNDLNRLRCAFKARHDEDIPRTESLMMTAAEGVRIFLERDSTKDAD